VQQVSTSLIGDPLSKHVVPVSTYIISGVDCYYVNCAHFFYDKTLSGWRLRVAQNWSGHSGNSRNYYPHLVSISRTL